MELIRLGLEGFSMVNSLLALVAVVTALAAVVAALAGSFLNDYLILSVSMACALASLACSSIDRK